MASRESYTKSLKTSPEDAPRSKIMEDESNFDQLSCSSLSSEDHFEQYESLPLYGSPEEKLLCLGENLILLNQGVVD